MSDSCRFTGAGSLDSRLADLGATLQPLVSPSHVGLLISAPERTLGGRGGCRHPLRIGTITHHARPGRCAREAAAHALESPRAPTAECTGALVDAECSWQRGAMGFAQAIAGVHINEMRRLHAELLAGARVSVLVVSDAETAEVARFVARRVSQLAPGTPLARAAAPTGPENLRGELTEDGPLAGRRRCACAGTRRQQLGASGLRQALGRALWASAASTSSLAGEKPRPSSPSAESRPRCARIAWLRSIRSVQEALSRAAAPARCRDCPAPDQSAARTERAAGPAPPAMGVPSSLAT